ncbi:MAG: riboflavin biosynthesis protein RibF [Synergistaceae bacterium]|jgi:riboflavin kinase/FMN adenylyltransferase|nr:riboflavin biosynthesis protein RibF [Synergistaceae bacterium]
MIFALGAFDGFHIGHQKLLEKARLRAEEKKIKWGVLTFDGNPQQFLNKSKLPQLFSDEEKDLLSQYFEIPTVVKIPFTRTIANLSPDDFLDFLSIKEKIEGLVIGENFRFGKDRTGGSIELNRLCKERNWSLDVVKNVRIENKIVSSTAIREYVLLGLLDEAKTMLGIPFFLSGAVKKGDSRGKSLGFPTANIKINPNKAYPTRGSYAALTFIKNKWHPVALNLGYNTTFVDNQILSCEAHILDFNENLYGKNIIIFLINKFRNEIKFDSKENFKKQLEEDIKYVRSVFTSYFKKNLTIFQKFTHNCFDM